MESSRVHDGDHDMARPPSSARAKPRPASTPRRSGPASRRSTSPTRPRFRFLPKLARVASLLAELGSLSGRDVDAELRRFVESKPARGEPASQRPSPGHRPAAGYTSTYLPGYAEGWHDPRTVGPGLEHRRWPGPRGVEYSRPGPPSALLSPGWVPVTQENSGVGLAPEWD
jgi:hypothetical protein